MKKILNSVHPDDDAHYASMGLTRNVVYPWELMYFGKAGANKKK